MDIKKIDISDSEWKVMQVLWESKDPLTLGEISNNLGDSVSWNKSTIHTLIRRLIDKGAVNFQEARYFKYYPLVTEKECLNKEVKEIIKSKFYSSPKKLMATLVESEDLTLDDIDEVMDILKGIKKRIDK